ncbi:MAG: F0F1 ATP synthase subunit A [Propionibacteriaceae bacterium]|nr:F0F1 ATP synthase subunit A [Micropruina sp.]HBX81548.1 ATP synthase F0 subunit A [Propionibacteriaceae bacterium]
MGLLSLIPLEGGGAEAELHGWPPGVDSFKAKPMWPGVLPDWFTNHILQAIIAAILIIAFWVWVTRNQKIVPGKKQAVGEMIYDLVRNSIARDIIGHDYHKYVPYLLAVFSFILVNNLFGEVFIFMFPTFSKIGFVYALALCSWLLYNLAGIKKHGFVGYLKLSTLPAGVPWPLWFLIIPLEFLSNIIVRPLTLALRLFANLFAGHLVVLVFVVGGTILLGSAEVFYKVAGGSAILFSFAIFALELLVSAIQAYIFTVLTAQYVSSAIAQEH